MARGDRHTAGLLAVLALMTACSSPTPRPSGAGTDAAAAKSPAVESEVVAESRLDGELLYEILVGEFAGQRGNIGLALSTYMDLARRTQDVKIAERATRIAVYARDAEAATEAAELWTLLDPENPDPHQVLAVMALREDRQDDALRHFEKVLDNSHDGLDEKLLMIANLLGREQDRTLILGLMERLVAKRHDSPEALYAFAHVAARFGDLDRSEQLLIETLRLTPDNDNAAMAYLSILQRQGKIDEALYWLEQKLPERAGDDFALRLAYARLLTDEKRFDEARAQFERLIVQDPDNGDVLFALGLLNLQANRIDEAELHFRRLADLGERLDSVSYYLGRIAEERSDYEQADGWYQGVNEGENYFDAQVRLGLILAKQGRLEDARAHLQTVRVQKAEQRTILVQAEGEMLSEQQRYEEAMRVYDAALAEGSDNDLLYARAMLAEKMGRLDILERDLRAILEQEPEHAQALNALGYTLADRTDRYQEAHDLIKRALELNPQDFYILDSMGWVLYRMGRLEDAVRYLREALALRQDPEIAAHLGEVLWVMGDREAAKQVWDTAISETPEDESLQDVIKRFKP